MKKKSSSPSLSIQKKAQSSSFEKTLKHQLSPLFKISEEKIRKKFITIKGYPYQQFLGKTTRIPSLNSCQNSELLQKKSSTEKLKHKKDRYPQKKKKAEKRNENTSQRLTMIPNLTKKNKTKEPRKSTKLIDKHFEFSKVMGQEKWRKSFQKNLPFQLKTKPFDISTLFEKIKQKSCESQLMPQREGFEYEGNKVLMKSEKSRYLLIDWMFSLSAFLAINRTTVHLAIQYMDSTLENNEESDEWHLLAAGSMLLSIKQQQKQHEQSIIQLMCSSESKEKQKEQILEMERKILISLNFKLKANTLPFWIDYFSSKWDIFMKQCQEQKFQNVRTLCTSLIQLRIPKIDSFKQYRKLVTLSDLCVMTGLCNKHDKSQLALGCLYLLTRIQLQKQTNKQNSPQQNSIIYKKYKKQFRKKATPIFRDHLRFNQLFNSFLTQLCEYELTEIIPSIKQISQFLDIHFSYEIDKKTFNEVIFLNILSLRAMKNSFKKYFTLLKSNSIV